MYCSLFAWCCLSFPMYVWMCFLMAHSCVDGFIHHHTSMHSLLTVSLDLQFAWSRSRRSWSKSARTDANVCRMHILALFVWTASLGDDGNGKDGTQAERNVQFQNVAELKVAQASSGVTSWGWQRVQDSKGLLFCWFDFSLILDSQICQKPNSIKCFYEFLAGRSKSGARASLDLKHRWFFWSHSQLGANCPLSGGKCGIIKQVLQSRPRLLQMTDCGKGWRNRCFLGQSFAAAAELFFLCVHVSVAKLHGGWHLGSVRLLKASISREKLWKNEEVSDMFGL